MRARTNPLVHKVVEKRALIAVSLLIASTLYASTAYALNTTTIDIETNDTPVINEETAVTETVESQNKQASESAFSDSEEPRTVNGVVLIKPTAPNQPAAPGQLGITTEQSHVQPVNDSANDVSETAPPTEREEGEPIVTEGSESSNDSDVRVRIRDRSDSEVNGDDVDNANSTFTLDIKESTSAD